MKQGGIPEAAQQKNKRKKKQKKQTQPQKNTPKKKKKPTQHKKKNKHKKKKRQKKKNQKKPHKNPKNIVTDPQKISHHNQNQNQRPTLCLESERLEWKILVGVSTRG